MTTSEQAEREMGCMVLENEEEEEEEEEEDEEEVFEEEGCWRKPAAVPELRWTGCTVPTCEDWYIFCFCLCLLFTPRGVGKKWAR